METIEEIKLKQKENDDFTRWRKRTNKGMPELAARVFALRSKGYVGCGFHWSLEKSLGFLIGRLNDYDDGSYYGVDAMAYQIGLQVAARFLYKNVAKAEKSCGINNI